MGLRLTSLQDPALSHFAVTPADGTDQPQMFRRLYIGTGGNVTITTAGNTQAQYMNVASGTYLDVMVKRVAVTGTSATNIVGII